MRTRTRAQLGAGPQLAHRARMSAERAHAARERPQTVPVAARANRSPDFIAVSRGKLHPAETRPVQGLQ